MKLPRKRVTRARHYLSPHLGRLGQSLTKQIGVTPQAQPGMAECVNSCYYYYYDREQQRVCVDACMLNHTR